MITQKFSKEPFTCCVCGRTAVGFGYVANQKTGKPVVWMCDDMRCIPLGKTVFHMPQDRLNILERDALLDAGAKAGAYLESIGKFSLDELTPDEWETFLTSVLTNYGAEMKRRLSEHAAPF